MTTILMSRNNPEGVELEVLLDKVSADLEEKNSFISGDSSPCSRRILANNNKIISMLQQCKAYQLDSLEQLDALGPNPGVGGTPRIGE